MDDSTITTATSIDTLSFVKVNGGNSLSLSIQPKHDLIGLDATVKSFDATVKSFSGDMVKASTTQICVSMRAAELADNEDERAPVDIIVALDVSGSMQGQKLKLCIQTLDLLLRVLMPQDRFGLVSYGTDAIIEFPAKRMTSENKAAALKIIHGLRIRGMTNISAAVGLAAQEMRSIETPNAVRSIFLLTDGLANQGITNPEDLVALTRNCLNKDERKVDVGGTEVDQTQKSFGRFSFVGNMFINKIDETKPISQPTKPITQPTTQEDVVSSDPPISFHAFGYGTDHNAQLLREMASATEGGSYYFVEDDNNVGSAFGSALGGILSVVAQNAVVTLQVPSEAKEMGVKITKIYHDQAIQRENGSYTVTMGDFYAEETRDLLLEVQLATPAMFTVQKGHAIPHVIASLAYTDTIDKRLSKLPPVVASIVRPAGTALSEENEHVAAQWLRSYAAQQMAEAERLAGQHRYAEARGSMAGVTSMFYTMSPGIQQQSAAIYSEVQCTMGDLQNESAYASLGSKKMNRRVMEHRTQRASAAAQPGSAYATSKVRDKYATILTPKTPKK